MAPIALAFRRCRADTATTMEGLVISAKSVLTPTCGAQHLPVHMHIAEHSTPKLTNPLRGSTTMALATLGTASLFVAFGINRETGRGVWRIVLMRGATKLPIGGSATQN